MEKYRFPGRRQGLTRKFICGADVYLTVNPLPDGQPGEVLVKIGKRGSTLSGLMHAWRSRSLPSCNVAYRGRSCEKNSKERRSNRATTSIRA